jgi:hypothetical protein
VEELWGLVQEGLLDSQDVLVLDILQVEEKVLVKVSPQDISEGWEALTNNPLPSQLPTPNHLAPLHPPGPLPGVPGQKVVAGHVPAHSTLHAAHMHLVTLQAVTVVHHVSQDPTVPTNTDRLLMITTNHTIYGNNKSVIKHKEVPLRMSVVRLSSSK